MAGETSWQEQAAMETNALFEGTDYSCSFSRARCEEPRMDYSHSLGLVEKACETEVSSMAQKAEKSWAES